MNKIDEVLELLKQRERESEKPKNVILWVLAIVGAVAAVGDGQQGVAFHCGERNGHQPCRIEP